MIARSFAAAIIVMICSLTVDVCGSQSVAATVSSSYYLSLSGMDSSDGKSPSTAWKSIERINSAHFKPGDTINLRGGDVFSGCMIFNNNNVPNSLSSLPLRVQNYGNGKATLMSNCPGTRISATQGPRSAALTIDGISGFVWNGPSIRGSGTVNPTQFGVLIENENTSLAADTIVIENSDVSGFLVPASAIADSAAEIFVLGYSLAGKCGSLNNIVIMNNVLHGESITSNDDAGISGYGCGKNISNVIYQGNKVYYMGGRSSAPNGASGNGIVANSVVEGTLQLNTVHDNGANTMNCGGPGGVWAYSADHITIQYNEVYAMQPYPSFKSGCDWAAYDLDAQVTNSVVQYNYSHENAGPGLLAYTNGGDKWGQNVFRFNISQNDNILTLDGGGSISLNPGSDLYVYNNTIYKSVNSSRQTPSSCWSTGYNGTYGAHTIVFNNICVNSSTDMYGRTRMVDGSTGAAGLGNILMGGNDYYNAGKGVTNFAWLANSYPNLIAFQGGTMQETKSISTNPGLVNAGGGGTLASTSNTESSLNAYRLGTNSPAVGVGVNLTSSPYNINMGIRDYFGNKVPNTTSSGINMGAQN